MKANKATIADHLLTTPHKAMIEALKAQFPEVQTSGFFRELATLGEYMADLLKHDPAWRQMVNIVPDAFSIDREGRHVTVFEIVDTSDLTPRKIAAISEIGWALDEDFYDIALVRIDKYGTTLMDPFTDELVRVAALPAPVAKVSA